MGLWQSIKNIDVASSLGIKQKNLPPPPAPTPEQQQQQAEATKAISLGYENKGLTADQVKTIADRFAKSSTAAEEAFQGAAEGTAQQQQDLAKRDTISAQRYGNAQGPVAGWDGYNAQLAGNIKDVNAINASGYSPIDFNKIPRATAISALYANDPKVKAASVVAPDRQAITGPTQQNVGFRGYDAQTTNYAPTSQLAASRVGSAEQDIMRAKQQQYLAALQTQALGGAPSLQQELLKEQRQKDLASVQAQAASARGGANAGLLARQLGNQTADISAQSSRNEMMARLAEQQAAQQQLGSALAGVRQQDFDLASTQAKLAQEAASQRYATETDVGLQTALANQQARQQAQQFGAQSANAALMRQAELAQQTELSRYGTQADLEKFYAGQGLAAQQANQDASLRADVSNQQALLQARLQNASLQSSTSQANQQAALQAALQNSSISADLAKANQTTNLQSQQMNQEAAIRMALANQAAQNQASQFTAQAGNEAGLADQQAYLTNQGQQMQQAQWNANFENQQYQYQQQLMAALRGEQVGTATAAADFQNQQLQQQQQQDLNYATLYANMLSGQQTQAAQNYQAQLGAIATSNAAKSQMAGQVVGGITAAGGAALGGFLASDKNLKKDIKQGDNKIKDFLNSLNSYEFNYKDEKHGQGKQYGIMAQDLQKSKVGKDLVDRLPDGLAIDTRKSTGPILASLAYLNKKNADLEARLEKLNKKKQ